MLLLGITTEQKNPITTPFSDRWLLQAGALPVRQQILDKYTIVEPQRTRTVYNWLQYFAPEELGSEFAGRGFSIEALHLDVAGTPFDRNSSEFAVIARRA